jgi:transposase
LEIHPFMLSRWRREARDGVLRGPVGRLPAAVPSREVQRLQRLERAHALLREEHALLKKVLRFRALRSAKRSPSSTPSGRRSA